MPSFRHGRTYTSNDFVATTPVKSWPGSRICILGALILQNPRNQQPVAPKTADGMAKIANQCDIASPEMASPSQTGEGQLKRTASATQLKRLAKPYAPQVMSNGETP